MMLSVQEDATTATWLESTSALLSSLLPSSSYTDNDDNEYGGDGVIHNDVEIEKTSASILTSTVGDLPLEVRNIIKTIHLRALIKLGRFHEVVVSSTMDDNNNREDTVRLESAYGLYRTRNYEACRKLCIRLLNTTSDENSSNKRGLMHIYAQTLYRLNEHSSANTVYHELLSSIVAEEEGGFIDINDEKEDTLSNALANYIVNHTPGIFSLDDSSTTTNENWVVNNVDVRKLLDTFCDETARKSGSNKNNDNILNYDLAYNLATYLLVTHTSRSQINIGTAMNLLLHAEKMALTNDDIDPTVAEYESYPISANLALSQLLLGGIDNEMLAYRTYLTLIMQIQKNKGGNTGKGGGEATITKNEGLDNIMAVLSNNIACLRDGKDCLVDIYKRIPSIMTSNRGGAGVDDAGGGLLLAGATPNQTRITLYNRALWHARMGNVAQCQETLHALRASLHVSYQGDVSERRTVNGHGGEEEASNTATTTSTNPRPTSNGHKKKKSGGGVTILPIAVDDTTTCGSKRKDNKVLTAKPRYDIELLAWEARADLLESEMYRVSEDKTSSKSMNILNAAISKLDAAMTDNNNVGSVISYTKSQLLLHRAAVVALTNESNGGSNKAVVIEALESLPLSVRSCPGTIVTMASLHDDVDSVMGTLSSLGDGRRAKLTMAEFYIERGQYKVAVNLLHGIVEEDKDDNDTEATAMLVKALSYIDPSKAKEYAALLQNAIDEGGIGRISELNGESLECMDVPRFAKQFDNGDGMTSKARKLITTTGGTNTHNERNNTKSRESILRKRAKQREAYLSRLEAEGKYNPNNIATKPDPERWIPKNQRSYNRRGRGKYKSNVGAQGGGLGVGMDKDSAKLDVAARVAAAKSGNGEGGDGIGGQKQPSTANIKVSTSTMVRKGKGGKRQ